MNTIADYQVEIDYRREQMLRDRQPIRWWRRARAAGAPKKRTR